MAISSVNRKALMRALKDDPDLGYALMTEMARMIRRTSKDAYG